MPRCAAAKPLLSVDEACLCTYAARTRPVPSNLRTDFTRDSGYAASMCGGASPRRQLNSPDLKIRRGEAPPHIAAAKPLLSVDEAAFPYSGH